MIPSRWCYLTSVDELDLKRTLLGGQTFTWTLTADELYIGTLNHEIIALKAKETDVLFYGHYDSDRRETQAETLRQYFGLNMTPGLRDLQTAWSRRSPYIRSLEQRQISGIRFLNQNPLEVFVAFICSSNNNIKRISRMIRTFCDLFGSLVQNEDLSLGQTAFPESISSIIEAKNFSEETFKTYGFGYRGHFLCASLAALAEDTLDIKAYDPAIDETSREHPAVMCYQPIRQALLASPSLKSVIEAADNLLVILVKALEEQYVSYEQVFRYLVGRFRGVGEKVADCILLYGLRCMNAVPIDVRMAKVIHGSSLKDEMGLEAETSPKKPSTLKRLFADLIGGDLLPGLAQLYVYAASSSGDEVIKKGATGLSPPVHEEVRKVRRIAVKRSGDFL